MKVGPTDEDQTLELNNLIDVQKNQTEGLQMTEMGNLSPHSGHSATKSIKQYQMQLGRQGKNTDMRIKNYIKGLLDAPSVTILMALITLFALVGDTLRNWWFSKDADTFFDALLILSMFLFSLEILMNTIVMEDFKYSYFFWLDIIATLSLIFDINPILDIFYIYVFLTKPSFLEVNVDLDQIVNDGEGTQIGHLLKSLRLIRLIRIIKLYKYVIKSKVPEDDDNTSKSVKKKKKKKDKEEKIKEQEPPQEEEMSIFMKETDPNKLGKTLSDMLNRQTITLILLMLMALPLLTVNEVDFSCDYALRETFWLGRSGALDFYSDNEHTLVTTEGWYQQLRFMKNAAFDDSIQKNQKELLWLYVPDFTRHGALTHIKEIPDFDGKIIWREDENCAGFNVSDNCLWRFNEMELIQYTPSECLKDPSLSCKQLRAFARYSIRPGKEDEARFSFFTIIFTVVILSIVSFSFQANITNKVETPIKKIIDIIQKLADEPLKKPLQPDLDDHREAEFKLKTKMLQLTIFKIGNLLQRGFGHKGAQIISRTLTNREDFMHLHIPGRKIQVVFSVCKIRRFPETIEQLGEEIISLVNRLIKIIHEVGEVWDGIPTNNYGEYYLLTWRLPIPSEDMPKNNDAGDAPKGSSEENQFKEGEDGQAVPKQNMPPYAPWKKEEPDEFEDLAESDIPKKRTQLADQALISAVKTIIEIERDSGLLAYQRHPRIETRFGKKYKTKVSFSLHVGMAIEGAIGTEMKIDYLNISPDASIAVRINELCEEYDTQILASGELFDLLSERAQQTVRAIDRIQIKEAQDDVIQLYSFEMREIDPLQEEGEEFDDHAPLNHYEKKPREIGKFILHEDFTQNIDNEAVDLEEIREASKDPVQKIFVMDHDFVCLAKQRDEIYDTEFQRGLEDYLSGDWINARNSFVLCQERIDMGEVHFRHDGAMQRLAHIIERAKMISPDDWVHGGPNAFNWDKKPVPPEVDFYGIDDDGEASDPAG